MSGEERNHHLANLREELKDQLCSAQRLHRPEGLPTGQSALDDRLLWGGFPKGEVTLLIGNKGRGATSLWLGTLQKVLAQKKWAAWIENEARLCATPLLQKQMDLSRLLVLRPKPISTPPIVNAAKNWLCLTQELLQSRIFETVGSGDPACMHLKESQFRKLLASCRASNTALVLLTDQEPPSYLELFALIVRFEKKQISVERALHRAPFRLERRISYANFIANFTPIGQAFPAHPLPAIQQNS